MLDALVVTLGLDASAFVKGQLQTADAFKKTKDQVVRASGEVERSATNMAGALSKATANLLELTAAFLGGRGFKEMIENAVKTNTAIGNLSSGLNVSSTWMTAFGIAAQRMGGSAQQSYASIQQLSDALVDLHTQGKSLPDALFILQAKSGKGIDFSHGVKQMTVDLAAAASILAKTDHATANRLLRSLGLDNATAELMIRQGPRMRQWIEMQQKLAPSPKDVAAAQAMTDAQQKLYASYDLLATKIMTAIGPALISFANWLERLIETIAKFVEEHPDLTKSFVAIGAALTATGIVKAIANILALKDALIGLKAANTIEAGAGLLGLLGRLGLLGLAGIEAADIYGHSSMASDDTETQRRANLARDPNYYRPGHPGGGDGNATDGGSGAGNDMIRRRATGGGSAHIDRLAQGRNAQAVIGELRKAGYSNNAIAAVIGSMQTESSLNPAVPENSYNHGHHGLWQWDSQRWPRIAGWIRSQGGDPMDAAWQARAWIAEHNAKPGDAIYDTEKTERGGRILRSNPSLGDAVHGVQLSERFGVGEEGGRAANAAAWLPHLQAPSPSASGQPDGDADYRAHRGGKVPMPANMPPPDPPSNTAHLQTDTPWRGMRRGQWPTQMHFGAAHAAALNNISNDNRASTTSTSNETHTHIANLNVNAPNATDAHGIARGMKEAMIANDVFGNFAPA